MVGHYEVFGLAEKRDKTQTGLKWWDLTTGAEVGSFAAEDKNDRLSLDFSPAGQTLAATTWHGEKAKLHLFRGPGGQPAKTHILGEKAKGERTIVRWPIFSPDGKWLALLTQVLPETSSDELDVQDVPQARIHLIEVATGAIRETLIAPQGIGLTARFSSDGLTLATSGHGRVLLWNLAKLPGTTDAARNP